MIYEGEKWSLKEEITCGAPQGSRVGPLVWNVMYDDFLRPAEDIEILELRINESVAGKALVG